MAQGIVAKIWNITAASGKSASAQISSSIDYIENPEKVGVMLDIDNVNQLNNQLMYVTDEIKTVDGLYVGGRHIMDFDNATSEMMQVKEFYGKLDGRVAMHGIISLSEEESDPRNAGKLMLLLNEFMERIFSEHQVVYAVHTNTENLHVHFVVNTVGLDGKKIHMDRSFMKKTFEPTLNQLAEKYGFTPNEKWRREPVVDKIPIAKRKVLLRKLIDHAIEQTDDVAAFIAYLRADGLEVNVGKHISVEMDDMVKAMRTNQLGENYTAKAIVRRLATKMDPLIWKGVGEHSHYLPQREMVNFVPAKMKRYQDTAQSAPNRQNKNSPPRKTRGGLRCLIQLGRVQAGVTLTCTAPPDGSDARSEPEQPARSERTEQRRARGRRSSGGCSGSRCPGSPDSCRRRAWTPE